MSDDEMLAAVADALADRDEPVVATKDVAARVDMGERGVRNRLKNLADEGRLNRSVIGDQAVLIYWLPEDEDDSANR